MTDFNRIALEIVQRIWGNEELDQPGLIIETRAVAEQLRQVWNARGAADLDAMETAHSNYNWTALEDALRSLDR